jgi:hypothetical protein
MQLQIHERREADIVLALPSESIDFDRDSVST